MFVVDANNYPKPLGFQPVVDANNYPKPFGGMPVVGNIAPPCCCY